MTTPRGATWLERLAEIVLVLVILAVTGATWLPALIGADPDPAAPIAREQKAALQREQELRRTRGPRATPVVPAPVVPTPGVPPHPSQEPPVTPSPAPGGPADVPEG
jgi:hypothetical protein